MEAEEALPGSKQPATRPYAETYEFGPRSPILLIEDPF